MPPLINTVSAAGGVAGALVELHRAKEVAVVRHPHGGHVQRLGALEERIDLDRAIRLYKALGKMEKVNQLYELLETNKTQGEVPESLEPYEGLLVPPDDFWKSPLCQ